MSETKQVYLFLGNHRCLDFVNTEMIVKGDLTDLLENFDDLLSWLVQAKLFSTPECRAMKAELNLGERESLLEQAKQIRATSRAFVERLAAGKAVPESAVRTINGFLARRSGYPELVRSKGGFEQRFHTVAAHKDNLLASLAQSASDLLCLPDKALIKKCGNAACILYFYDTSKNHRRAWCSMRLCGNRMKVAAFFQRKKKQAER